MGISRLAAALLVATVGLAAAAMPASASDKRHGAAVHGEACKTYENRARFLSREGSVSFVVAMAEGCAAAQRSLRTGTAEERQAAAAYLDRLVALRDLVIRMNMTRMYGAKRSPRSKPIQREGRLTAFYGVSETGEFLIAHRMGLIDAFRAWRAETPGVGIAFAD